MKVEIATNYVVGFLVRDGFDDLDEAFERGVCLIRKNKPEWQRGLRNGVGGKIEDGEDAIWAMRREFQEETGALVAEWRQFADLELARGGHVYCFISECGADVDIATTTDEPVAWYDLDDVLRGEIDMPENVPWLLKMALDPNHVHAVITYSPGTGLR